MIQLSSTYRPTPWRTLRLELEYTYRSARRDGFTRRQAARQFGRELLKGWQLDLNLHPKYDRHGRPRS